MYKCRASAAASRVFLLSNLDWFWSSKRQNNCSHISRWTLSGLKQLSFTWFSINHVLVSNLIIRIFWGALLSLFLSGGMIFISHLLRRLYFFISQLALHCIICLDHFSLILLRHIIGDIERPLIFRSFYVSICSTVINISLMYITSIRISSLFVHINISICSKLHIFAQSLNKIELFCLHILTVLDYMSYKSLYQNMKHICKLFVLDLTQRVSKRFHF